MTTPTPAAPPPRPLPAPIYRDMNIDQRRVLRAADQSLANLLKGK